MLTYYEILGVGKTAEAKEIGMAYHRLMRVHHPDVHGYRDDPLVRLINSAHDTLSDASKRRAYDLKIANLTPESASKNNRNPEASALSVVKKERVDCPDCQGKGRTGFFQKTCNRCGGAGKLTQLTAPPGRSFCSECQGQGGKMPSPFGEFMFQCDHCKGRGLEPIEPVKEQCEKCGGRGYDPKLGVTFSCNYCAGKGWLPTAKFP